MSVQCPEYTIILAGGKGSRMGSNTIPKVCFEIDGIPAVNRAKSVEDEQAQTQENEIVQQTEHRDQIIRAREEQVADWQAQNEQF